MRRGHTILELVVSLALLAVVLLLVAQLLMQSQAVFVTAGRNARDPVPDHALTLLRRDVIQARSARIGPNGELVLVPASGGTVTWRKSLDRLERQSSDDAQPRVLLTGVAIWQWQELAPGLLEFQLAYWVSAQPLSRVLGNPMRLIREAGSLETVNLRLGLRSPGSVTW